MSTFLNVLISRRVFNGCWKISFIQASGSTCIPIIHKIKGCSIKLMLLNRNGLLSNSLSYPLRLFRLYVHLQKLRKKRQRVKPTTMMERVGTSILFCLAQHKTQSSILYSRRSRTRGSCDVEISRTDLSTSRSGDGFSMLD